MIIKIFDEAKQVPSALLISAALNSVMEVNECFRTQSHILAADPLREEDTELHVG